ncbi:hypothetical protein FB451DRAFT_1400562 [Mycena latifolia]|nr:hypothetical protein FB451DRAFT_1400562 [Mycena latifolia]
MTIKCFTVLSEKGLVSNSGTAKHPDRIQALHALPSKKSLEEYGARFREFTTQKIKERSWKYDGVPGNYIDIVKSVINAAVVHWAADRLVGLPVKTKDNPRGPYTEAEYYEMFAALFTYCLPSAIPGILLIDPPQVYIHSFEALICLY